MRKKTGTVVKTKRRTAADEFPARMREKLLLWCARHCCLCGKPCDVLIDIHHIKPVEKGGTNDEDNAIPLCFDCHGKVGHYNEMHPKGTRFREAELKMRRDQIYDKHTQHLVPALKYRITGEPRELPDVGFTISHPGGTPPVRATIALDIYIDGRATKLQGFYGGDYRWNLNPGEGVNGHFPVPKAALRARDLRVVLNIEVFDVYGRAHCLLPVTWVFERAKPSRTRGGWWLDPIGSERIHERIRARRQGRS